MIRLKQGHNYEQTVIDGWIVKFIPNLSKSIPMINKSLKDIDIPDQIISCPLKLILLMQIVIKLNMIALWRLDFME